MSGFLTDELSKRTSIFGLRLWVVLGICVGAAIVLVLFLISIWFTCKRSTSKKTLSVSAKKNPNIPKVSKEIQEIRIDPIRTLPENPKLLPAPAPAPIPEPDSFEEKTQNSDDYQRTLIEIGKGQKIANPGRVGQGGGSSHGSEEARTNEQAIMLAEQLDGWLRAAGLAKSSDVRGVIAPHAGYSYSGRAAAYAFGNIDPTNISRIFLLGPSHHYYTPKCALSRATVYKTPIGDLPIDEEVNDELKATGHFEYMDLRVDEDEHSMEMHLPYLAKVFQGYPVKIVPILVGALSAESEALYGRFLAKYVDDSKNFFSVSSDFCHWGSRFNYMHYDKSHGAIYKSIEVLDKMGMDIIETGDPDAFKQYLSETDNTICGRHPISVLLHMLKNSSTKIKIRFLRYEQSSQCKSMRDSSVSYASAVGKVDG